MEGLTQNDKIVWSCWETKTPREVVREAAAKGTHVSLAYRFIQHKHSWDLPTAQEWFSAEVFFWVLQLLSRKQYFKASHVLNKINVAPHKHILTIAHESLDDSLRDYIVEQLNKTADDLRKDCPDVWKLFIDHYNLLKLLKKSFQMDGGLLKQNKAFGIGRDLIVVTLVDVNNLSIDKIQKYPDDWKQRIATFLFLDTLDFSIAVFLNGGLFWKTLLLQNKAIVLKRWITIYFSKDLNVDRDSAAEEFILMKKDLNSLESPNMLKQVDSMFLNWPITQEMIDLVSVSKCFDFTKLCIYDTLCSYGHVIDEERSDVKLILQRLSRTYNLGKTDQIFSKSNSTVKKSEFNNMLAKYCVENNEYQAMTSCVDDTLLEKKVTIDGSSSTLNCLDLWQLFKATISEKDVTKYVHSIYETCRHLSEGNISKYLSENPFLIVAMLVFASENTLFDIFTHDRVLKIQNITIDIQKSMQSSLPHLYSVFQGFKDNSLIVENDVNVYQLLGNYRGLDVLKIFEFQLVDRAANLRKSLDKNLQASEISTDSKSVDSLDLLEDMPHFSSQQLVKKYGYVRRLNYIYYLKQNRPCMASQALFMEQYQNFNRRNVKMIKEACTNAHVMALQNWKDAILTTSCISFISMIGCDSIKCRTHVASVNLIASYLETSPDQMDNDIDKIAISLIRNNSEDVINVLNLLERAVFVNIRNKNEKLHPKSVCISQVLYEWQTVVRFAYLHRLPLPESQLNYFVSKNLWMPFLIFGDVFKYPVQTMITLSRGFSDRSLTEHIHHAISHQITEDNHDTDSIKSFKDEQRRTSRESSMDTYSSVIKTDDFTLMGDLWEVMAYCHGLEDPPGVLLRASAVLKCPLLALLATCYEPDAVDTCWAQWILSSLGITNPEVVFKVDQWDTSDLQLSDELVKSIMEECLRQGHYTTLHSSLKIFYRESPLCILLDVIIQAMKSYESGPEITNLLISFNKQSARRASVVGGADGAWLSRLVRPRFVQSVSVSLVTITLIDGLKSSSHQKALLQCLCDSKFSNNLMVPCPDFNMLIMLLNISMECNLIIDLKEILGENSKPALHGYIDELISFRKFDEALRFANTCNISNDSILIAEWTEKLQSQKQSEDMNDLNNSNWILKFWASCSQAFMHANVNPKATAQFMKQHCDEITDSCHKFYILRFIYGWLEKSSSPTLYDTDLDNNLIEYEMWRAYLSHDSEEKLQLLSIDNTYEYILNRNFDEQDPNDCTAITFTASEAPFNRLLKNIEEDSKVNDMTIIGKSLTAKEADRWYRAMLKLLAGDQVLEVWRLSNMFTAPSGHVPRPVCSRQLLETCLRLAEGSLSPYELSLTMHGIFPSRSWLSDNTCAESQCSQDSFEELVLIPDKNDDFAEEATQLAGRLEADCLSALETLAVKSGSRIAKQVASFYRISLQIGWSYERVLKYEGDPLDLINYLTGRARMPLAKVIFRTYNISSEKIVEYLCTEIVSAIVSPHLMKTSTFRHKEHFHYTLWGYPLDTNFEMFLNMRPDDNSTLGRLILEHLSAFRKFFKSDGTIASVPAKKADNAEIDGTDAGLDDEYDDIEDEVQSQYSGSTAEASSSKKPFDAQSIMSGLSSIYSYARRIRDKRPQNDVISCTNVHIRQSVKNNMKSIIKGTKLATKQINIISIELLVLAHECFSSVCDTEGIATSLRSAQTLTSHLLLARSWRLMVRLLTGIARYAEMAYVFQMLKDNNQFEFLLGQFDYMLGQHKDKIANFKQGLLEFLRKHCPEDTDKYCLVAHRFSMYPEAADVKKKQANDLIVTLTQMALDSMHALKKRKAQQPEWIIIPNNDSTRLLLDTAMNHCSTGATYYAEGGCLGAAREMAGLAQVIALQMALLSNSPTRLILKLSQEKMASLIDSYLSFMEGLVYAYASDGGGGGWVARWKEIVYQRALRGNDAVFIKDIATHRPDMACYIVERYEHEKVQRKTPQSEAMVAELRGYFK